MHQIGNSVQGPSRRVDPMQRPFMERPLLMQAAPMQRSREYTRAQMYEIGNSVQGPSRRVDPMEADLMQ